VYKILPYVEQQNLYNNWVYTSPVKVLVDPGRPGNGLSSIPFNPADVGKDQTNASSLYRAGPVTDYAANDMVIGSAENTTAVQTYDPSWSGPVSGWHPFNRTIQTILDGSSNTILLGVKAMATNVYGIRGQTNFTLSNGTQGSTEDDPIACAGPDNMGLLRGQCPDTVWYMSGPLNTSQPYVTYIPGNTFGITGGWQSWFQYTFQIVQDKRDLDAFNRWGSPYSGGSLFAMADGSVRMLAYSVPNTAVITFLTPQGGEVPPPY
jgi:hypothetical protein